MATACASSNKAKIAKRVIEVLDYFDDNHREATVMDIVRRYNRPQSSTSELLSSLVELGLLYKEPYSRSYRLTPRAALIGSSGQPDMVRDGRLVRLIDRLVAQTGLCVGLFGMVGLNAQLLSWRPGGRAASPATREIFGGMQAPLTETSAGLLLLSTVETRRRDGMLRRLNAEASEDRKFTCAEMVERINATGATGQVDGSLGFGSRAQLVAMLLPPQDRDSPLAIGLAYGAEDQANADSLLDCIREAIEQVLGAAASLGGTVELLPTAA